jgi:DNA-directed RNA polymerase specialized sigma24 family protein
MGSSMTSPFPDTQWSQIRRASEESPVGSRDEMGKLLQQYWRPMFVHLRYKRLSEQQAEDLIQDFVVEILTNNLLSVADPKKGRFRTLLLTALDRFMISRFRYEGAAKRSPGTIASLNQLEIDAGHDVESEASLAFERAWALDVLAETVARMEQECHDVGETARWNLFQRRIIGPLLEDLPLADYEELAAEYGLDNPKQAMNLVVTAKRQFARVLRDVIREYVTRHPRGEEVQRAGAFDPSKTASGDSLSDLLRGNRISQQIEQELSDLRDVLGRSGSVADLAVELRHGTDEGVQKNSRYWSSLTQEAVWSRKPWEALFTLGTEQNEDNLAAAFQEILELDMGALGLIGRNGQSIHKFLVTRPTNPEVLRFLKSTMNLQRIEKNPTCPVPVANAMYYLIVAVARVEHGEWISGLERPQLEQALVWLLEQSWIGDEYRSVVQEALDRLRSDAAQ